MPDEPVIPPVPEPVTPPADLGDAGKQAIDRMKAERDEARKEARRTKELEAELERLRNSTATDAEKAVNAAKAEGAKEANEKANDRILRSEVRALAAGKLNDPADAISLLDLSDFAVGDDGEVDDKAITKALDALVAEKPYLAAQQGPRVPGVPAGARQGPQAPDMNQLLRRAAGREA